MFFITALPPHSMDFDEYESLPRSSTVSVHMTAGAMAGVMEHCIMYPVDSVKTRMQSLNPTGPTYRNVGEALGRMVRQEGIRTPLRGMSAVVSGACPAHALYFASYERAKASLTFFLPQPIAYGAAGCCATVLHDAIMTPAEVVKQRMQMYGSPYRSCLECARHVLRKEGPLAFYRSYTTQLSINIPFQSLHFIIYESMQGWTNPSHQYNPPAHMLSGGIAGAVAAGVTTPLDVCKTLLNTQDPHALSSAQQHRVHGLVNAIRTVYRLGGMRAYFQGLSARVLYQVPSTAISWSVYEFFKFTIVHHNDEGEGEGISQSLPPSSTPHTSNVYSLTTGTAVHPAFLKS